MGGGGGGDDGRLMNGLTLTFTSLISYLLLPCFFVHFGFPFSPSSFIQGCLEEYIMNDMLDIRDHMQILPVGVLQRKINDNFHIDGRLMAKWNSPYDFVLHAAGLRDKKKDTLLQLNASLHNSSSFIPF